MKPTDEFLSPPSILELTRLILNAPIDFDPYASAGQLVKARDALTKNNPSEPWPSSGNWYVNPPFSESGQVIARLAQHFARNPNITALVLCLAAPGSTYWREWVWSKEFGPRRVAWMPRLSFFQLDGDGVAKPTKSNISRELAFMLWTPNDKVVQRFEKHCSEFKPTKRGSDKPIHVQAGGRP